MYDKLTYPKWFYRFFIPKTPDNHSIAMEVR